MSRASERCIKWLKHARRSGENTDVIVRVASEEFKLHLYPLLRESIYFQKLVNGDPTLNQEPKSVVDIHDFPGGPENFQVVVDHCQGLKEHKISISNVGEVICASDFLEVESLKSRAFKFLDENVFNCWKSCLRVLAIHYRKDDPPIGDELFDRCKKAFLDNIKTKNPLNSPEYTDSSMFCNVAHLLTVATLLPANMAKHLFDCILYEAPGLFYRVKDNKTPPAILLSKGQDAGFEELELDAGSMIWVEKLPEVLPHLAKRAVLLSCLCGLMTQDESTTIRSINFLCLLLVEVFETSEAMVSRDMPWDGLKPLIAATQDIVVLYMDELHPSVLQKCKFATILSMVKGIWFPDDCEEIDRIAEVVDVCLLSHLNRRSLSVAQVLRIYQEFPNSGRSNHRGIYSVFKDLLKSKTMSFEHRKDFQGLADFKKLPDKWVRRIFQELELDHDPRLLTRVLEIHAKRTKRLKINEPFKTDTDKECSSFLKESLELVKHFNVFMTAAARVQEANDKVQLQLQQQAVELAALRDEKLRLESALEDEMETVATVNEEKSNLTMILASMTAELDTSRRELEEEREERLCLICFERQRDAQCLPCKHFLYCYTCLNRHMQQSRTCPMCRTPFTGVNPVSAGAS